MVPNDKIFISYRRSDSEAITGRIGDRLVAEFGSESVFKDVDSLLPGIDFDRQLSEAVGKCDICLVVIGPGWAELDKNGEPRVFHDNDYVQIEIREALNREIPVIPLLVQGASIPTCEQMPAELHRLRMKHALEVLRDPDFHRSLDRIIADIKCLPGGQEPSERPQDPADHSDGRATTPCAPSPPAVGIDLGTSYSAVAVLDDLGRPITLFNSEGDRLTPSTLLFEGNNEVVVGKEAVMAMATDYESIAEGPKRELGNQLVSKILNGKQYPPEALQGWILNKLRSDAVSQIGEFSKVVITVPAYFDEVRRKATMDAGYMAGFEVMDVINEPTAAAVAFGFQHGLSESDGIRRNILVYDLGGGTFDVTVMDIGPREFQTLATDGDVQLGGRDWDQRLVDYVAEQFVRQHSLDPREDPNTLGRLWRDCQNGKQTLSARNKVNITCDFKGKSIRIEVNRHAFEEMTRDLLDRTAFTTRQTLQAAGLEWTDIDRVLLIGGSTRMPAVIDMIRRLSGMEPDRSVSPDEAVAHGAALHAQLLLSKVAGMPPSIAIKNVNSHSLGVVAKDVNTNRSRNAILIPRNTPLPVTAMRVFQTKRADQRSIRVNIVEGESGSPEDCTQIGSCVVRDLPADLKAGTRIEVRFKYKDNGRLTVRVKVAGTDTDLRHEIMRASCLTNDQRDSWRKFISNMPPTTPAN